MVLHGPELSGGAQLEELCDLGRRTGVRRLLVRVLFRIIVGLVIALLVVGVVLPAGPLGTLEVRIDSGDRRQRLWLISLPEGAVAGREHLVKLAAEIGVSAEWHRPPFTAPSNTDQGRHFQYSRMAWWAEHEPGLAKIMLKEFAEYYQNPPRESGYPPSARFLFLLEQSESGGYQLKRVQDWGHDAAMLRESLSEVGYQPAPGGVLDSAIAELEAREMEERSEEAVDDALP